MTTRTNLEIYQGDDYAATVAVVEADQTPADLTGYTVRAQIRRDIADRAGLGVEITATITDAPAGMITLAISRNITATLKGSNVWDLELVAADGIVSTILAGAVQVTGEVTRPAVTT